MEMIKSPQMELNFLIISNIKDLSTEPATKTNFAIYFQSDGAVPRRRVLQQKQQTAAAPVDM